MFFLIFIFYDRMLSEILDTRIMVKAGLKLAKVNIFYKIQNHIFNYFKNIKIFKIETWRQSNCKGVRRTPIRFEIVGKCDIWLYEW